MIEQLYLHSARPGAPKLRVGILADDLALIRPFAVVVDHLLRADFVDLALVALHDAAPEAAPPPGKLHTLADPRRRKLILYSLYEKFDRKQNAAAAALMDLVDCRQRLAAVPQIRVRPEKKGSSQYFPAPALERLREARLDVLLRFGFGILRGDVLSCARHGVWSYHHGDNDQYRGGPAHFWEMVERNPLSGVVLQILSEELDAGFVLTKALSPTESKTSLAVNRLAPYTAGFTMVIRKLWELHSYGFEHLRQHAVAPAPYQGRQKIYRRPENGAMVRYLAPAVARMARNRLTQPSSTVHWRMGVRRRTATEPHPPDGSLRGIQWIEAPRGRFFADPFGIRRQDQDWLFFEDYHYSTRRGVISAAPLTPDGRLGEITPVLERPYHLSYPFLWEQDGELFMIPESGAGKKVELLRCRRFPDQWEPVRVLFEGPAADTTLLQGEGRIWFFTTLLDRPASEQLFLFSAPTLFAPWEHHPASPVSLDVRTARCGGAFFAGGDGARIRVAQDGSRRYGYATRFQRVARLNEREYAEEAAGALEPSGTLKGLHTYNRLPDWEIFDGQWVEPLGQVT